MFGKEEDEIELKVKPKKLNIVRCSEVADGLIRCELSYKGKTATLTINEKEKSLRVKSDDWTPKKEGLFG